MNERMNGWMMVSQFYAEGVRVVNVEQRNSAVGREFQIWHLGVRVERLTCAGTYV